jgi:hypothetical protein
LQWKCIMQVNLLGVFVFFLFFFLVAVGVVVVSGSGEDFRGPN